MDNIIFDKELPTYSVRESLQNTIIAKYPFIKSFSIGKSAANRDLHAFHIGLASPCILLTGGYHGTEWQTSIVLLKFLYEVCRYLSEDNKDLYDVKRIIGEKGIMIVPCVNPDGVEISISGCEASGKYKELVKSIGQTDLWKANARGVDINHNFDADWQNLHKMEIATGITTPSRTRYGGLYPESEPETKAIVNLCRKNKFSCAFAFHSQGEEIYWSFGEKTPKCSQTIAQKFAKLSGYTVSEPTGLAVGGGFKDWFITEFEKPGFTVEIGKGENPLPISDFEGIYSKLREALFFVLTL